VKTTTVYPLSPRAAAAAYRRHRGQWLESSPPSVWPGHSAAGRSRGILRSVIISVLAAVAGMLSATLAAVAVASVLGPLIGFLPSFFPAAAAAFGCIWSASRFVCFIR
jgi:hypothetical protein